MADRTTITVSSGTKELLDEQRDSRSWDDFLRELAESEDQRVIIHPDSVEEIASITASETAEALETRFR